MKIWIDGVCEPNPYGDTGIGIYFEDGTEISRKIEPATNNVAEYTALLTALQEAIRRKIEEVEILTDSQLLVNQVNGSWEVKSETAKKFVPLIKKLKKNFKKFKLSWVPREENEKADMLSKKAIGYIIERVESESKKGVFYVVMVKKEGWRSCTCPDFKFRGKSNGYICKHIEKILKEKEENANTKNAT